MERPWCICESFVGKGLTLLLPWAHICAFGQIQVLAEFETSVFDEVYVRFSRIYDWKTIFHDFTKYLVLFPPCISQCIGFNWHALILISQKYKTSLASRVKFYCHWFRDGGYILATQPSKQGYINPLHITTIPSLNCCTLIRSCEGLKLVVYNNLCVINLCIDTSPQHTLCLWVSTPFALIHYMQIILKSLQSTHSTFFYMYYEVQVTTYLCISTHLNLMGIYMGGNLEPGIQTCNVGLGKALSLLNINIP